MSQCPENASFETCGYVAAQDLVNNHHIIIDPFDEYGEAVRIAQDDLDKLNILIPGWFKGVSGYNIADFCCTACGRVIEIRSNIKGMEVCIVE